MIHLPLSPMVHVDIALQVQGSIGNRANFSDMAAPRMDCQGSMARTQAS